jgi:hypothetical protein
MYKMICHDGWAHHSHSGGTTTPLAVTRPTTAGRGGDEACDAAVGVAATRDSGDVLRQKGCTAIMQRLPATRSRQRRTTTG